MFSFRECLVFRVTVLKVKRRFNTTPIGVFLGSALLTLALGSCAFFPVTLV